MNAQHVVVIVGGAVAGSEAAFQLTRRGIRCVVIDHRHVGALAQEQFRGGKPETAGCARDDAGLAVEERHALEAPFGEGRERAGSAAPR